ncbi:hypothetical protein K443DRAFT_286797 [Laccaria amethystina LaAM-08-1]|uniref:Uncharacterized protein n=1 Tax=Laccaria amethystina LaAM-08-1 TaxID=1095629 RepID=A0A0C9Y7J7_9AGAR|nr:hypothetical protein K443DRAFT_286797 [Laccaria amethystina LaAM-08-1]
MNNVCLQPALLLILLPFVAVALPFVTTEKSSANDADVVFMTLIKRDDPPPSHPPERMSGQVIKYIVVFSILFILLLGALYWLRKTKCMDRAPRQPTRIVVVPTAPPGSSRPNLFLFAPRGREDPSLRSSPPGSTQRTHSFEEHSQHSAHSMTNISRPPPAYHPTAAPASHGLPSNVSNGNGV